MMELIQIIGRQGALCGNVQLVSGKFHATEHAVVATPYDGINVIWLYHALSALNLNQYSTGLAQPGLSVSKIQQIRVVNATTEQQNQFAAFVRQCDKTKADAQKCKEVLLARRGQAIEKYFN